MADDMGIAAANLRWARILVDQLVLEGVSHVCLSPGARSAPLVLATQDRADLTSTVHIDERSAAFFALGRGKATGLPSAVICTSGTAGANYFPAVIEASLGRVPMIVLTADRPPELRDTGARQATNQLMLYGGYVRWFADLPPPDGGPPEAYLRSVASRSVAESVGRPPGPVHLNVPFREPLVPPPEIWADGSERGATRGRRAAEEVARTSAPQREQVPGEQPSLAELADRLAELIAETPNGLILAGPIEASPGYADAVAALARAAQYPVLAEPEGQMRFGPHDKGMVVSAYDAILRAEDWAAGHVPDLALRLGRSFTSKRLQQFLTENGQVRQLVVDPDGVRDDPTRLVRDWLSADETALCLALARSLSRRRSAGSPGESSGGDWLTDWLEAEHAACEVVRQSVATSGALEVAWVYPALIGAMPDGALLFAANSMAVRDLDLFGGLTDSSVRCLSNRGAAGIDGTASTALGAAHASGAFTVLVAGDLAFLHDVNGLAAAKEPGLSMLALVLNDDGGGIFDYLPVADYPADIFEPCFRAASRIDIQSVCAAYGVRYSRIADPAELTERLSAVRGSQGVEVAEVVVHPVSNYRTHLEVWRRVAALLA